MQVRVRALLNMHIGNDVHNAGSEFMLEAEAATALSKPTKEVPGGVVQILDGKPAAQAAGNPAPMPKPVDDKKLTTKGGGK